MSIFECLPYWYVLMILCCDVQKNVKHLNLEPLQGTQGKARWKSSKWSHGWFRKHSETQKFWPKQYESIRDIVPQLCAAPSISWKLTLIDHALESFRIWFDESWTRISSIWFHESKILPNRRKLVCVAIKSLCVSLRHASQCFTLNFLRNPSFVPFRRVTFPVSARRPRSK